MTDTVVLDRQRNRHIAFGIHRCAGSNMARILLFTFDNSETIR